MMKLEASWHKELKEEFDKSYVKDLKSFLEKEKNQATVYPPESLVFNAFLQTPFASVKVVIVGQDPYHGMGQAHGLSFSVQEGITFPPSLKNIFKELESDVGVIAPKNGCLLNWAKQGVLLLNAVLTVRAKEPASHAKMGWELFTDAVITRLFKREDPIVFLLWGKYAQDKYHNIIQGNKGPHEVLMAPHPSPYSASSGFFGCKHFSKANAFLQRCGKTPINWQI
jgi:uracil-DNA glycosylase